MTDEARAQRDRAAAADAGLSPVAFSTAPPSRRCQGGTTRVSPMHIRRECRTCDRLRPFGEEPGPDDIDPVGAWVDATAQRAGFCRERIAHNPLSCEQVAAMDDTAGLHASHRVPAPGRQPSHGLGGCESVHQHSGAVSPAASPEGEA